MARYIGPVCKLCRREGMKLYLKGERCYSEKCGLQAPPLPARPARPGPHQAPRVRRAAAREAEGARIYGVARAAVPRLLPRGHALQGPHRREDARAPRAPPRQRRLPAGLRRAAPRRASSCATATSWSTASASTSRRYLVAPATRSRFARRAAKIKRIDGSRSARSSAAACRSGSSSTRTNFTGAVKAMPVARGLHHARSASSSIVEFYSQVATLPGRDGCAECRDRAASTSSCDRKDLDPGARTWLDPTPQCFARTGAT